MKVSFAVTALLVVLSSANAINWKALQQELKNFDHQVKKLFADIRAAIIDDSSVTAEKIKPEFENHEATVLIKIDYAVLGAMREELTEEYVMEMSGHVSAEIGAVHQLVSGNMEQVSTRGRSNVQTLFDKGTENLEGQFEKIVALIKG